MSLSIDAKEFVPLIENEKKPPLKASLSVDVPEFVPKSHNIEKGDSKVLNNKQKAKKKLSNSISKNSKSTEENRATGSDSFKNFNPREDVNWAKTTSFENLSGDYSVRHDKNWFNCVPSKSKLKEKLKRSDSCNVNPRKENYHQKEKLLQTYSTGVSEQAQRKFQQRTEKKVLFLLIHKILSFCTDFQLITKGYKLSSCMNY